MPAVGPADSDHDLVVHSRGGHASHGTDHARRADGELGEPVSVDAHVEGRSSAQCWVEHPRRRVGPHRPADVGGCQPDHAEVPAAQHLVEHVELGQVARPYRFGGENASSSGRFGDLGGLEGRDRDGFLDQHMLARGDRLKSERIVLAVRRAHVDDVDVRVGNQRVVRTVDAVDAMGVGEPTRPVARAGPHGGDTLVGVGQDGRDEVAGDGPRCEHAPPKDGTAAQRRLCDVREPAG